MAWLRGFTICADDARPRVKMALSQAVACEVVRAGGETAFAFAGRGLPDLDPQDAVTVGLDARNGGRFFVNDAGFRPGVLVPVVGLTVGIALNAGDADPALWSPFRRALWEKLGTPEERGDSGELTGFRWDVECALHRGDDTVLQRKMEAVEKNLIKLKINYWMAKFDRGGGITSGDLDLGEDDHELGGMYLGPNAIISLRWTRDDGTQQDIVATEAEFITDDSGELPESEIWTL